MSPQDPPAPPGVVMLSRRASSVFEPAWHEATGPTHFWMEWRLRAFHAQLRALSVRVDLPALVLEVGGGRGVCRSQLERTTAWTIDLCDLDLSALARCAPGRGQVLFYDVAERLADRRGRYESVILFDVLEHVDDTHVFLDAVLDHLRPGGHLFVNVPALPRLSSAYDTVLGHYRRYTPTTLAAEFGGRPVAIRDMRYWGLSMLPLLALRAATMRRAPPGPAARAHLARRGCEPPIRGVDALLRALMRAETSLPGRVPLGTSLLCACRTTALPA